MAKKSLVRLKRWRRARHQGASTLMSVATQEFPGNSANSPLYHRVYRLRGTLERQSFDQSYVTRLIHGDAETERHFSRYFGELLSIKLRCRLRSSHLVDDARQETFLRVLNVLRNKGGLEHPERLGAFVNAVCDNVLSEFFRAGSRYQQPPENAPDPEDESASADSEYITEERKKLIRQVLNKLSDTDRMVLRRVFLEDRDKDEVCRELGIDRGYLRVRVHRALARFRSALEKDTGIKSFATAVS
jgi:RNA polymerase sigma-70 factor, ECF subfamily